MATCVLVNKGANCKMQRVAVSETIQGQNIGSRMLDFFHSYAREKGFLTVYCHARGTAVGFYLRNAYEIESDYFEEQGIPHVQMRKN